jgi:hypothetical protein
MDGISYDVRIWAIGTYRGAKVTTYTVRWKVGSRPWKRSFRIFAQADSFRAELLAAARRGEAFAIETGLPASWRRDNLAVSWYDFTCSYVDMKWKPASAKYRRAIAQALAAALPATSVWNGRCCGAACEPGRARGLARLGAAGHAPGLWRS